MAMSLNDAQLFYDRAIPAGVVDPNAPDRFAHRNAVRLVNVREKPEATRARMAQAMEMLAGSGTIAHEQLRRVGFTAAEIEAHAEEALRAMLATNPTFTSIQFGA